MKLIQQLKFYCRIIKFKLTDINTDAIPRGTHYCEQCPYWDYDPMASSQSYGYCHYIGKGDSKMYFWGLYWSKGTDLLWDGCKECDIK